MKKLINFVLEFTILLGIMFATMLVPAGIFDSNKDMVIIGMLAGVAAAIANTFRERMQLQYKIRRESMHINRHPNGLR